jgi:hypothetical protein
MSSLWGKPTVMKPVKVSSGFLQGFLACPVEAGHATSDGGYNHSIEETKSTP